MSTEINLARINDDALIGSTPPADLEGIDIAASKDAYDTALLDSIRASYPDATVELADNFRVYVDDDPASEAAQDIAADVSNEAERIFNSGSFWIEQS